MGRKEDIEKIVMDSRLISAENAKKAEDDRLARVRLETTRRLTAYKKLVDLGLVSLFEGIKDSGLMPGSTVHWYEEEGELALIFDHEISQDPDYDDTFKSVSCKMSSDKLRIWGIKHYEAEIRPDYEDGLEWFKVEYNQFKREKTSVGIKTIAEVLSMVLADPSQMMPFKRNLY